MPYSISENLNTGSGYSISENIGNNNGYSISDNVVPQEMPVEVPVGIDKQTYIDLDKIFEEYGGRYKLTKEKILADPRLMDIVRSSLEARYMPGGVLTKARRTAVGLAGGDFGGFSGRDYRSMSDEKVFEIWQNWMRSFSGGQTVTTGNELAYGMNAPDEIKVQLGAAYKLFDDGMTNAIVGDGTLSEMGDAIWDYTKAAVYDPSTLLGLGLGKLITFGATKTTAQTARKLMLAAYKEAVKNGATKKFAIQQIGNAALKTLPLAFVDATIGAGTDVGYQMQLIDVGVQEEYSAAQTALSFAGAMVVIPTLSSLGASVKEFRRGPLKKTFLAFDEFEENFAKLGAQEAENILKVSVSENMDSIIKSVDENFGLIKGDTKNFLLWPEIKQKAKKKNIKIGKLNDAEALNAFYQYFWLGDPENGTKGFFQALQEAGFVAHPALIEKYGTITGVYANAITEFLPKGKAKEIVKQFEDNTGYKIEFADVLRDRNTGEVIVDKEGRAVLKTITKGDDVTASALGLTFADSVSKAGEALWLPSELGRLQKSGLSIKDAIDMAAGNLSKEDSPQRRQFFLSTYKRLLTSHLSTTGANLKGFTAMVSINNLADIVTGALNYSQGTFYKYGLNDFASAEKYFNEGYGNIFGSIRRGFDVISPDIPMEYAEMVFNLNPKVKEKLFRDVTGDGGVRESFEHFNLDKADIITNAAGKVLDAYTKGVQTITLVRLQDDLTKRWAFGTNLNQRIMSVYGVRPSEFFARPDVGLEMASSKFKEQVLDRAVFRTLRETASVNWSTLPTRNGFRAMAKTIENLTNTADNFGQGTLGFIFPFGSFLNTTIATMADYTGLNMLRTMHREITGKTADLADSTVVESMSKAAVGLSAISLGIPAARDRISQGLGFNADRKDDGSIEDRTYDWPISTIRLMSQMVAHGMGTSNDIKDFRLQNVPQDLFDELALQLGGQAVRDLDYASQSLLYFARELTQGNAQPLLDVLNGSYSTVVQGFTRHLEPINVVAGIVTDQNLNPNLREGDKLQNEIIKYVNNIPTLFSKENLAKDLPKKATPFRGKYFNPDIGKLILGIRTLEEPNIMEQLANAAGMKYWDVFKVTAPKSVQNQMNSIAQPFFESRAVEALKKYPNYFRMSQDRKEFVIAEISEAVKQDVFKVIEDGMPKSISIIRLLSNKNKKEVQNVIDFLNIDGVNKLDDVLDKKDSLGILLKIQSLVDIYDEIFYNEFNMD